MKHTIRKIAILSLMILPFGLAGQVTSVVTSPTRDECKNDGWKNFIDPDTGEVFGNQGRCTSRAIKNSRLYVESERNKRNLLLAEAREKYRDATLSAKNKRQDSIDEAYRNRRADVVEAAVLDMVARKLALSDSRDVYKTATGQARETYYSEVRDARIVYRDEAKNANDIYQEAIQNRQQKI